MAALVALAGAVGIYALLIGVLGLPWDSPDDTPAGRSQRKLLVEVFKASLGVAAGLGAVVALAIAYRRHRIEESQSLRDDQRLFTERFEASAEQLGHAQPAVRLAGVHSMARLADDWDEQRQTCIDVLCAYLRLPWGALDSREHGGVGNDSRQGGRRTAPGREPSTIRLPAWDPPDAVAGSALAASAHAAEREVRQTIVRLIAEHLRTDPDDTKSQNWHGHNFDFTGALFIDIDLSFNNVVFSGGTLNFADASFAGSTLSFNGVEFSGGEVSFSYAQFSGGTLSFYGVEFSGGTLNFADASFSGGTLSFYGVEFSAGTLNFADASFSGGTLSFSNARFSGGNVSFKGAVFSDAAVEFGGAFSGGTLSFSNARFSGGNVSFEGVEFSGADVSFNNAKFSGGNVSFEGVEFSGADVSFNYAKFSGADVSFNYAKFSGADVPFNNAKFSGGNVSFHCAHFSGGHVPFDGAEFSGSDVSFNYALFSGSTVDVSQPSSWQHPPTFDETDSSTPGLLLPSSAS